MAFWRDNADSWICSNCGYETNNPNNLFKGPTICPSCRIKMYDYFISHNPADFDYSKTDSYTVNYAFPYDYCTKEKLFSEKEYDAPLIAARRFVKRLMDEDNNVCYELWLNANPHRKNASRYGKLLDFT